jgi:hypothetical protein
LYCAGSGELEFEEFVTLSARFLVEEDAEAMQQELREAFRLYDKEGKHADASKSVVIFELYTQRGCFSGRHRSFSILKQDHHVSGTRFWSTERRTKSRKTAKIKIDFSTNRHALGLNDIYRNV